MTLGEVMRKRLRRITEELGALSTSLPLSSDSSILLAVDAQRMDVLRALLLPHPDTPYGGGAFLFDIYLPENYPDKPPMVSLSAIGMPCKCLVGVPCGLPVALWQRCLPTCNVCSCWPLCC
jgi:ubiquitin-protein ligase